MLLDIVRYDGLIQGNSRKKYHNICLYKKMKKKDSKLKQKELMNKKVNFKLKNIILKKYYQFNI
jgi:hypothetical protein